MAIEARKIVLVEGKEYETETNTPLESHVSYNLLFRHALAGKSHHLLQKRRIDIILATYHI